MQLGQDAEIGEGALRGAMIASLVFALVLFIGVPVGISTLLRHGAAPSISAVLIEGVIRAAILIAYLLLIGMIPNVPPALSISRRRAHGDQLARVR